MTANDAQLQGSIFVFSDTPSFLYGFYKVHSSIIYHDRDVVKIFMARADAARNGFQQQFD
jgi:hypothetical protein